MATIIPEINPCDIDNDGERVAYSKLLKLSDKFEVFYDFKYRYNGNYQADFVIVHPEHGFMVLEVKGGYDYTYNNGVWYEGENQINDPIVQAEKAGYYILERYKSEYKKAIRSHYVNAKIMFPGKIAHMVVFPFGKLKGEQLPANYTESNIIAKDYMDKLEDKIIQCFEGTSPKFSYVKNKIKAIRESTVIIVKKILNPKCKIELSLRDYKNFVTEQSGTAIIKDMDVVIKSLEENNKILFTGGAGTGKSYLAKELAVKMVEQNKKVLLVCHNVALVKCELIKAKVKIKKSKYHLIDIFPFFKFIELFFKKYNIHYKDGENNAYYKYLFQEFCEAITTCHGIEKYDAIIIDEGQDFSNIWIQYLEEGLLKSEGKCYIFIDENQNIYKPSDNTSRIIDNLNTKHYTKYKLLKNYRNSEKIFSWYLNNIVDLKDTKSYIVCGEDVCILEYKNGPDQVSKIKDVIGKLVSKGVPVGKITILSTDKKEKSCLKDIDKIGLWCILDMKEAIESGKDVEKFNSLKFSTIHYSKGLEFDVVIVIDVDYPETGVNVEKYLNLLYTGVSRAKVYLYILKKENLSFEELKLHREVAVD